MTTNRRRRRRIALRVAAVAAASAVGMSVGLGINWLDTGGSTHLAVAKTLTTSIAPALPTTQPREPRIPQRSKTTSPPKPAPPKPKPKPKPEPRPEPRGADRITIAVSGDMLPHDQIDAQAKLDGGGSYDFGPMLAGVAGVIRSADWAICHQETPISDNNIGVAGYPYFNAPYQLARAEKAAGFDACSTASNHSYDLGAGGVAATLGTLDRFGLRHSGTARSPEEAARLPIYTVKGVRVGHLSYTYGVNDDPKVPSWIVNRLVASRVRADAHRLKEQGADIVIVSVHAGDEDDPTPSAYQITMDNAIMRSPDVDLIVGAHAHVVQPIKRLDDGRWIIYGLGNLLAHQQLSAEEPPIANRHGVIVRVTFSRSHGAYRISQMGFVPTFMTLPVDRAIVAPASSHAYTAAVLRSMGAPLVDLVHR